jgi:hypothetical protein
MPTTTPNLWGAENPVMGSEQREPAQQHVGAVAVWPAVDRAQVQYLLHVPPAAEVRSSRLLKVLLRDFGVAWAQCSGGSDAEVRSASLLPGAQLAGARDSR